MENKTFFDKYKFTIILVLIMIIIESIVLYAGKTSIKGVPEINITMICILTIVGLAAGLLGGWIGTGGCSVMLPVLHFWLGFPAPIAVGTTLFAVIFTAVSGGYGHFKQKNLDKRVTLWMGGAGILGVLFGSWLFTFLVAKSTLLGFIIGIVFLWPSFRMIWEGVKGYKSRKIVSNNAPSPQDNKIEGSPAKLSIFGAIVGALTGIIGLGGGYALVPGLIYLFIWSTCLYYYGYFFSSNDTNGCSWRNY